MQDTTNKVEHEKSYDTVYSLVRGYKDWRFPNNHSPAWRTYLPDIGYIPMLVSGAISAHVSEAEGASRERNKQENKARRARDFQSQLAELFHLESASHL